VIGMGSVLRLTLISRTYCHLCEEMAMAVAPLLDEYGVEMEIVDVDGDPELEARFGEFVPVLLSGNTELSRFRLDMSKVRDYLEEIR
jgi:thioredoxin reductase (NADPH)